MADNVLVIDEPDSSLHICPSCCSENVIRDRFRTDAYKCLRCHQRWRYR
jgi:ribosomal protein L37AE/L43A